jgi:hypothetical protein
VTFPIYFLVEPAYTQDGKIRPILKQEVSMNELLAVLTLTIVRFLIPFGVILIIGTLVKRSKPALR